jgi:hypothetical protein
MLQNLSMGFSPTISFLHVYPNPTLLANAFWCISDTSTFRTFRTGTYSDKLNEFEELFYISQCTLYLKASIFKVGVWHQTGKKNLLQLSLMKKRLVIMLHKKVV